MGAKYDPYDLARLTGFTSFMLNNLMKKRIIIPASLILIGLILLIIPYFLATEPVKNNLTARFNKVMGVDSAISQINWQWLPRPHVSFHQVKLKKEFINVEAPRARIYPSWRVFFLHQMDISKVVLEDPLIKVDNSLFNAKTNSFPLPLTDVYLLNSALTFLNNDVTATPLKSFTIKNLDLNLVKGRDFHHLFAKGQPSFSKKIDMRAKLASATGLISGSTTINGLVLSNLLQNKNITPITSAVNLKCDFVITDPNNFELDFNGNLPGFTIHRLEDKALLEFGKASFKVVKKERKITLDIGKLAVIEPALTLQGKVERYHTSASEQANYRLDLQADHIDLSAVRSKLLTLLADSDTVQTVCDIVRSGRAEHASYYFDGPPDRFAFIKDMLIKVDVARADIQVPDIDLYLKDATGPIIFKNGILAGQGLSTWLSSNHGSNGSFELDLTDRSKLFNLDLDINADLAELPLILHNLIDNKSFRREAKKFNGKGRLDGHLNIGHDLDNFTVKVNIADLTGAIINYQRLPWPLKLKKGSLEINGNKASWHELKANSGPHQIIESSGETSWQQENAPTNINSLTAIVDSAALIQHLADYPVPAQAIDSVLKSSTGKIQIVNGKAHGPFFQPQKWQYRLAMETEDLKINPRDLPGPINLKNRKFSLDHHNLSITPGQVDLQGDVLDMALNLNHKNFRNWQGSLFMDGMISPNHGKWLRQTNLIPPRFFPKLPARLSNFTVTSQNDLIKAMGTVVNKTIDDHEARCTMDITVDRSGGQQGTLHFHNAKENGELKFKQKSPDAPLNLNWQGRIRQSTMAALFAEHLVHSGKLNGNFKVIAPASGPINLDGWAQANDLQWLWGNQLRQIAIRDLDLSSNDHGLTINKMDLEFEQEESSINGQILFQPNQYELDLQHRAISLSQQKFMNFLSDLDYFLSTRSKKGESDKEPTHITGKIKLETDEFQLTPGKDKAGKPQQSYYLQPLRGTMHLTGSDQDLLELEDSRLCGLKINGTLRWENGSSKRDLLLSSDDDPYPMFESFLPCVGSKKELIEGPFTIEANIKDDNGIYRDGNIKLISRQGTLRRMVLLGKIFQVINFTDLSSTFFEKGFRYKFLEIESHIKDDVMIIDKAVLEGEGMNILAKGSVDLASSQADMIFYIVPFKTFDQLLGQVPLFGKIATRILGGKKGHLLTIPLSVKGDIKDPKVNALPPEEVGQAAMDFIMGTITLPIDIISGKEKILN